MSLREQDAFRPKRRRGTPEKDVQRAILATLRAHGWRVAVTDAGQAYRAGGWSGWAVPAGWPDLTAMGPNGLVLLIEVKAERGRQSPAQVEMEQWLTRNGHRYVLARSVEDVEAAMKGFAQ